MNERYQHLYKLPGKAYCSSCPIIIMAGALLKDAETSKLIAQLKFKNISNKIVCGIKVTIHAYSLNGMETETISDFPYLDLNVLRDDEFGSKTPIYLNNKETRKFFVEISEIVFSNGEIIKYDSNSDEWIILDNPPKISDILESKELVFQYSLDCGGKVNNAPTELSMLRYCACGSINEKNEQICHSCGRNFEDLIHKLDKDILSEHIYERKKKKSKILKNIALISLISVLIISIFLIVLVKIIIPNIKYDHAISLMESEDYAEAITAFEEISQFKDSSAKIQECKNEIKIQNDYDYAVVMMKNGYWDYAISSFESLGDYKDSKEKIEECKLKKNDQIYNSAIKLMDGNDFETAISIFESLGDYKDSKEKVEECKLQQTDHIYNSAIKLMDGNDFETAISIFESLGDYKDSKEKVEECRKIIIENKYVFALNAMSINDFKYAISIFESLGDYKDSKEKIIECNECLNLLETFRFVKEGQSYSVSAASTEIKGDIIIPSYFNGLAVTIIDENGFYGCEKITSVFVPKTITTIKTRSFNMCYKIKDFIYEGSIEEWNSVYKGYSWNLGTAFSYIRCENGSVLK